MKRVRYDYGTFVKDLRNLADRLPEKYDAIVAVARGGMTMAHMMGEYLDIRPVFVINSIGYEGTRKLDAPHVFNVPELPDCQKVLILDDIADSGETLAAVRKILEKRYPEIEFTTATLFYKPKKSIVEPDIWLNEVEDEWIDFFWSDDLREMEPDA